MKPVLSRDGQLAYAGGKHYALRVCAQLPADAFDNVAFRNSLCVRCCFNTTDISCRAFSTLREEQYGCRPWMRRDDNAPCVFGWWEEAK